MNPANELTALLARLEGVWTSPEGAASSRPSKWELTPLALPG